MCITSCQNSGVLLAAGLQQNFLRERKKKPTIIKLNTSERSASDKVGGKRSKRDHEIKILEFV